MEAKAAASGRGDAVLARTGVVDFDGDVLWPGGLANDPDAWVPLSLAEHVSIIAGAPPVGRARVREDRDAGEIRAEVEWDAAQEEACRWVQDDRPEWSWGYQVLQSREPTDEERRRGARRVLLRYRISEVSPVSRAASIGTRTGSVCCGGECSTGKAACETREAALKELARFERTRARMLMDEFEAERQRLDARRATLETHERKAWEVRPAIRTAAEEAVELAAEILGGEPPRIRWYDAAAIPTLKVYGISYKGEPAIWIGARDDAEAVYATACHETFHALRPDGSEEAAQWFGDAMGMLRGLDLHVGSRKQHEGEVRHRWSGTYLGHAGERIRVGALPDGALLVEAGVIYGRAEDGWQRLGTLEPV